MGNFARQGTVLFAFAAYPSHQHRVRQLVVRGTSSLFAWNWRAWLDPVQRNGNPRIHIGYFGPSHLGPLHTHVAAPYTPPTSPRGSKLSLRLGIGWEGSGFGFLELRDGIAC